MEKVRQKFGGYTLIEVTAVLFTIGLISAIAAPSMLSFWQGQQIKTAANQLRSALYTAKSEGSKNSVRYAVTVCAKPPDSSSPNSIQYSIHPYSNPPDRFTTIEQVYLVKSTVNISPRGYNLPSLNNGDCYTSYLGLFPGDGYSLGFFYLSNKEQTYIYRVGFNTLIGNIISCPILSLEKIKCQ